MLGGMSQGYIVSQILASCRTSRVCFLFESPFSPPSFSFGHAQYLLIAVEVPRATPMDSSVQKKKNSRH